MAGRSSAGRRGATAQRVALALVGGYGLSSALAALGAVGLSVLIPRSEAVVLMVMLAFVFYLLGLIWAFAEPRLSRLWWGLGLGGGGAVAVQWLIGAMG